MYFVYILYSNSLSNYYIGHCQSLSKRLGQHNKGKVRSTKRGVPWQIVYTEIFTTRLQASMREKQIKSYKSGEAFKKLVRQINRGSVPKWSNGADCKSAGLAPS